MVLRWSQILAVAYFVNIVCCGIIKSSKESTNLVNIFKMPKMNEIDRAVKICPAENSEVPVFLVHSDDCSKFYICDNGTPYLKSCQPGLYFNPKVNSCDYPKNVECDKKDGIKEKGRIVEKVFDTCPLENSEDPVYLIHDTDCGKFYICDNGEAHLKSCQLGLHFNPKIHACDYPENAGCDKNTGIKEKSRITGDEFQSCPKGNFTDLIYLSHPSDCGKFYICDNGTPHLKSCHPGLHFNKKVNACDYPKNAECHKSVEVKGKESVSENEFDTCPSENSNDPVYFTHPKDCGKFYVCDNGTPHLESCPVGLHFNPKVNACDYPKNAGCDKSSLEGRMVDDTSHVCSDASSDFPTYFPHPANCNRFYVCNSGNLHEVKCPLGLHFNSKINACDYPKNVKCDTVLQGMALRSAENQHGDLLDACPFETNGRPLFIPHSTECDKFFICNGGKKFPFTCPSGLYFNSKQEACDFPENTDCEKRKFMRAGVSSPFCPPMDGKSPVFYRHSNNCSVYYMCGNGLAYEFSCPARLHFNLRKKVCDYEVNAKCKVAGL